MTKKITFAAILAVLVGLSGCATYDPYTGEKEVSKTAIGAGIGAVAGAVVGVMNASDGEELEDAIIGAGIGALAGGGVGYYMDQQAAELRKQLRGTGVSVTQRGNRIILNMPGNITFETESAALKSSFYDVLNSVALVLQEYEKTGIKIAGHTDSRGSDSYNMRLSRERAESVADYLATRGIPRVRMLTVGYGETQPIATNETAAGRQKNRRVTLTLIPVTAD